MGGTGSGAGKRSSNFFAAAASRGGKPMPASARGQAAVAEAHPSSRRTAARSASSSTIESSTSPAAQRGAVAVAPPHRRQPGLQRGHALGRQAARRVHQPPAAAAVLGLHDVPLEHPQREGRRLRPPRKGPLGLVRGDDWDAAAGYRVVLPLGNGRIAPRAVEKVEVAITAACRSGLANLKRETCWSSLQSAARAMAALTSVRSALSGADNGRTFSSKMSV
eukprot:CAMPEP_0179983036 /NCGR_PEP_ID=MMETSP0984-20121128/313_1 /TAXON_ID=483367 /ORGANISM="non described non described, Strain CCMP 2436" /LENGTH=220 /DNA_ID=CAMNT_0021901385 /DNA_START=21 /DNA_END=684 /DNA_ORIENTATION=-